MKLLWYSDALAFKRNGKSITGMPYYAIEMGAVPECFEVLVHVDGVKFEVNHYFEDDREQYRLLKNDDIEIKSLTKEELSTIDTVIANLGSMRTKEIVDVMHKETAFKKTKQNELISFEYAKELSRLS